MFYRVFPDLKTGGTTPVCMPVRVQLLGQHLIWLAENIARVVDLGSLVVDLNFGCPVKTVNKSKGRAVFLNEPNTLFSIVSAVRKAGRI